MEGRLFTLVNAENYEQVFAWGMQITDDLRTEAVILHRDPDTGKTLTGTHESAEAALRLWSVTAPMKLLWEPTVDDVLTSLANLDR